MGYQSGKIVLDRISFSAKPGQKIGLCGETGSGKTSTVSLLSRLYDFQSGEILIDGHDIRSLKRQELRSRIGFVSQDVVIFRGSLRENLDDSGLVPDHEILGACCQTGLSRAMEERTLSLDTLILDKGANLSVGERQLIALTRVLIKKPSILVLDEATGNIDPQTEELVHSAVGAVMAGKTCLVIAHRLDTLKSCDQLLVFKDGMITESGKHNELIQRRGYYSELVASGGYCEPTTLYAEVD
jgi:ABC-type multidrug transport system fused ATPase/permease subunit